MSFPPLALGSSADPIVSPTAQQIADLLSCGALDLGLLNGILKLIADRVDAIDAADNAITGATYNATTNVLTFTMADGAPVVIDMAALIADSVATGIITGSSYNATTNILTLTTANGDNIEVDLSSVISDAVSSAVTPSGGIIMFTGASAPTGWAFCDGTNGTPDLRGKFIIAAGGGYGAGSSGGAATHNHTGAVGASLTGASISTTTNPNIDAGGSANPDPLDSATLADPGHTHSLAVDPASSLPPYYALAYIMKL